MNKYTTQITTPTVYFLNESVTEDDLKKFGFTKVAEYVTSPIYKRKNMYFNHKGQLIITHTRCSDSPSVTTILQQMLMKNIIKSEK